MTNEISPVVSIGFPVYNGAQHVRLALRSILSQDYKSFEVVVSDNCSTDNTYKICCSVAAEDPRVRVVRALRNEGAVANFNRVLLEARGRYFMWAAHDDVRASGYLSACVAALDGNPTAAVAQSRVRLIDENGALVGPVFCNHLPPSAGPLDRFEAAINSPWWTQVVYGLFRREVLIARGGLGTMMSSDKILVARIALEAPIIEVPFPLFDYRISRQLLSTPLEGQPWYRTVKSTRSSIYRTFPLAEAAVAYARAISQSPLSLNERSRAYGIIFQWYVVETQLLPMAARVKNLVSIPPHLERLLRSTVMRLRNQYLRSE